MDFIREIFSIPFGYLIGFFYQISDNYLLSLLLMTICVKLILLPSSIKQQKGMVKTQRMQPKIKRIKEKYAGNQQKINEATQELYAKEGYSSMAGGCLPMLIQFPIMIGVYSVNYKLLSYVLRIEESALNVIKDAGRTLEAYTNLISKNGDTKNAEYRLESLIIEHFDTLVNDGKLSGVSADVIAKIDTVIDNFQLFGIDLSRIPDTKMGADPLWLIPILTGITSLMMGVYTWMRQKKTNPEMANNPSMGCMSLMTPAMSVWFSFMFPASVGVYIIISSLLSFIQMLITNKIYSPKKLLAKAMIDETINRRAREKILKNVADTLDDNNTEV